MNNWDREQERKAGKAMGIGMNIFAISFVIIWCLTALVIGAGFMLIFGLPMLGFLCFRLAVLLKKHKAEQSPREPWDQPDRTSAYWESSQRQTGSFCPYCGMEIQSNFAFCPKCGRRISK